MDANELGRRPASPRFNSDGKAYAGQGGLTIRQYATTDNAFMHADSLIERMAGEAT